MIKNHIKSTIRKAQAGIAFIIVAAVLSQVINALQYVYTRRNIRKQSVENTYKNMVKLQRTANLQTSVESAVEATMGEVTVQLGDPDQFYGITSRLVSHNDYIVGCAIAMRPGYYPQKDKLFAPFAYPENKNGKGQPRVKLLPYDYTKQEWFATPFQKDSAMWTEPYFDKGGSDLLVRTFSKPIHDNAGRVVGILTAQILGLLLVVYIVWKYTSKFKQVNHLIMEQELLTKELQIASDIQTAMQPNISDIENARHHLDVQKLLISAPDVSADFYDYFYVGSKVIFCIGDVPGSNVKAALMMSIIRSIFRTSASINTVNGEAPSPATVIRSMNNSLCTVNHNEMFATLFVGVLDLNNAILTYTNAGNPAPVVVSPSTRLESSAHHNDAPKKMLSSMQEAVESYRGSAPQEDDILMLTLRMI